MNATLIVDTEGRISAWSRDAEDLLGYSAREMLGQSIEQIIPENLRARHRAGFVRFVRTGVSVLPEVVTTPALHKTGRVVAVEISVEAVRGEDGITAVRATLRLPGARPRDVRR